MVWGQWGGAWRPRASASGTHGHPQACESGSQGGPYMALRGRYPKIQRPIGAYGEAGLWAILRGGVGAQGLG